MIGRGRAVRGLEDAIGRARSRLLSHQRNDGHWCGELEADSVLESEFVILLHVLGRGRSEDARKAAESIRRRQRPDGAWSIYPGGPDDVSASVKAYLALKLLGDDPRAPHMARARRVVRRLGGVDAANTYTKIYLALVGEYDWSQCPAVPPEMVLLPRWFYFNLQAISSWSRGIFVPLSIVWAYRPVVRLPPEARIPELRRDDVSPPDADDTEGWTAFFYRVDSLLKALERFGLTPLRERALDAAETWILERSEASDGLGAIFPAIVNAVLALRCRGYGLDHPAVRSQMDALEKMTIREDGALRLQPALSPVWDTAQSMVALETAGLPADHPALGRGAAWLLDQEVDREGDWSAHVDAEPSGWCFEYANEFYPDSDDTAEVLLALRGVEPTDPDLDRRVAAARERGLSWLLAMQNVDGGWAAFDRGCGHREILTHIPFADHNALLDPSCADITGRVLELLAREGFDRTDEEVRRAVAFLRREQGDDGTWYGRWGCNYIYGTCFALRGLSSVGENMARDRYRRAVRWLEAVQNEDGGWGETLGSYEDPSRKGEGPSTAAQTAWALLALEAAGEARTDAVERGLGYLLRTQTEEGAWEDRWWTGTGFPEVFYLRYGYYDDYFPLQALASWREAELSPDVRSVPTLRATRRGDVSEERRSLPAE